MIIAQVIPQPLTQFYFRLVISMQSMLREYRLVSKLVNLQEICEVGHI